jgi:hypothetical protein
MNWDLTKTTTMQVYNCDLEYLREKIVGVTDKDRLHTLITQPHEHYNDPVTNILRRAGKMSGMNDEEIDKEISRYHKSIL